MTVPVVADLYAACRQALPADQRPSHILWHAIHHAQARPGWRAAPWAGGGTLPASLPPCLSACLPARWTCLPLRTLVPCHMCALPLRLFQLLSLCNCSNNKSMRSWPGLKTCWFAPAVGSCFTGGSKTSWWVAVGGGGWVWGLGQLVGGWVGWVGDGRACRGTGQVRRGPMPALTSEWGFGYCRAGTASRAYELGICGQREGAQCPFWPHYVPDRITCCRLTAGRLPVLACPPAQESPRSRHWMENGYVPKSVWSITHERPGMALALLTNGGACCGRCGSCHPASWRKPSRLALCVRTTCQSTPQSKGFFSFSSSHYSAQACACCLSA